MSKPTRDEAVGALSILWHAFGLEGHNAGELVRELEKTSPDWQRRLPERISEGEQKGFNCAIAWRRARDVLVREGILK